MKTTLIHLAAAACTQQSAVPAPEAILTPALKIALAQYALRYIYPQRQFVPAMEWQLQQVYLRQTVQNCRFLHTLAHAGASEQTQFLQTALSPLPSAITLSATPRLLIDIAPPPTPLRQIAVLLKVGHKFIPFAFDFCGEPGTDPNAKL